MAPSSLSSRERWGGGSGYSQVGEKVGETAIVVVRAAGWRATVPGRESGSKYFTRATDGAALTKCSNRPPDDIGGRSPPFHSVTPQRPPPTKGRVEGVR